MQGKVRDLDIKYWITTIMKFVCVDALIYFGPTIVVLAMQLGNTFIDYFLNNPIALTKGEDGADYVNAVADYFANGQGKHFTKALSLYVYSLLLQGSAHNHHGHSYEVQPFLPDHNMLPAPDTLRKGHLIRF